MDLQTFWTSEQFGSYINGHIVEGTPSDYVSLLTKKKWKSVYQASRQQVRDAIAHAQRALAIWKEVPPKEKAAILRGIGDLLRDNRERLAELMAYEMGKSRRDGLSEVAYAAGFFDWFAGEAERHFERTLAGEKTIRYLKEPVGVCGLITPWNFPLAMPARKIAPALAAGCSMVIKPSPECPFSALFIALACAEAGVPPGVVNVAVGPEQEIGEELLYSPIVRKIGFTGSTEVGKYLYEHSAQTLKKLTLELGGQAPVVVLDDADLDHTARQILVAKFRNNGQTCIAANRLYVQKGIHDSLIEKLIREIQKLSVGDPLQAETDLTTCLHPGVSPKISSHIEDALAKGAAVAFGGKAPYDPTLLINASHDMRITQEETFGPVLPVIAFENEEEAYQLANSTPYGLMAYLFTTGRVEEGIKALDFGIIGVNDGLPSTPELSFGGRKESGFGVEGGPEGIEEYCISKCVSIEALR